MINDDWSFGDSVGNERLSMSCEWWWSCWFCDCEPPDSYFGSYLLGPCSYFSALVGVEPSSTSAPVLLVVVTGGFDVGVLLSNVNGSPGELLLGTGPINVEYEWPFNVANGRAISFRKFTIHMFEKRKIRTKKKKKRKTTTKKNHDENWRKRKGKKNRKIKIITNNEENNNKSLNLDYSVSFHMKENFAGCRIFCAWWGVGTLSAILGVFGVRWFFSLLFFATQIH